MLRRAHARHRNLRTLAPAPCSAAGPHPDRNHPAVTRHGSNTSRRAAPALPARMPLAPATSPVAPTSDSTDCPGPDSGLKLFPIIASRGVGVDRGGHLGARPTTRKPLSPSTSARGTRLPALEDIVHLPVPDFLHRSSHRDSRVRFPLSAVRQHLLSSPETAGLRTATPKRSLTLYKANCVAFFIVYRNDRNWR